MSESSWGARGKHWSADHSVGRFGQQRRGVAPPPSNLGGESLWASSVKTSRTPRTHHLGPGENKQACPPGQAKGRRSSGASQAAPPRGDGRDRLHRRGAWEARGQGTVI